MLSAATIEDGVAPPNGALLGWEKSDVKTGGSEGATGGGGGIGSGTG